MRVNNSFHLSYCTNIHPGESWEEVFNNLKKYLPGLKSRLSPDQPFGIGLRLSNAASQELEGSEAVSVFKEWLYKHGLYVFTINGFPFGGFHHQVVKENVHTPDWTTYDRLAYTKRLAWILAELLPEGMEGGISTSPLSYKPWCKNEQELKELFEGTTANLLQVVEELQLIKSRTGKLIHIDIEPEPDGVLENSDEVIHYFKQWLLPKAIEKFAQPGKLSIPETETTVFNHVQVCYDVCHFALAYEQPSVVLPKLTAAGIKIGKIQFSSALKVKIPTDSSAKTALSQVLAPFMESTYLHQVVARDAKGELTHYADLPLALAKINEASATEWRIHFHVPLFTGTYQGLESTQKDIEEVIAYLIDQPITQHLEVETYTWEVLPPELKTDLLQSIQRELDWVTAQLKQLEYA